MSKNKNLKSVVYPRFEFQEFEIIEAHIPHKSDTNQELNNVVDQVIHDHFVHLQNEENEKSSSLSIDGQAIQPPAIDIDSIKSEAYDNGYKKAHEELQKVIDEYKVNYDIAVTLNEKIKSIKTIDNLDVQLLNSFAATLKAIADLMHVNMPVDFEKIVTGSMLNFIKQHYETGNVKITVHDTKVDYCTKILQKNSMKEYQDALVIVGNNELELNGCVVELKNTQFVYSPEHIKEQVNKIISELNIAGN